MATASARSTSTRWKGPGRCCAPGCARTGASRRTSCRSISASSSSCTTPAVAAEPCSAPSPRLWSGDEGDEGAITPDPNKRCPSACRAPPRDENGATSDGRFWLTLGPAGAWRPAVVGGIDPAQEIGPRRAQGPPKVAAGFVRSARGPASVFRPAAPRPPPLVEANMEAIVERAAGLDVHQSTVVACVIIGAAGRRPSKEVRSFGTMRQDLAALRAWLLEKGVTHVGMEGTGVYWQPVHAALEGAFTLIVGNAAHIRNVPGRKTDVKDAEWIADLVRHGLVRASFVPPPEVRVLLRYRRKLIEAQAAERNRLLRLLETANIKLASVMSDVFGVSGRAM